MVDRCTWGFQVRVLGSRPDAELKELRFGWCYEKRLSCQERQQPFKTSSAFEYPGRRRGNDEIAFQAAPIKEIFK
ncbi:hypothetical protein CEXT_231521 [Caerostris extrusa]|uniref:Uncharacterized protein n=1 Tax=Caerostris extrusa TaxID=172846 RepID=A0AAV4T4L0_CAEEX|nr:hypothetical protein CEXT_231521 [Caerostris extrusa]